MNNKKLSYFATFAPAFHVWSKVCKEKVPVRPDETSSEAMLSSGDRGPIGHPFVPIHIKKGPTRHLFVLHYPVALILPW